ncbi:MAG: hypothetical protein O2955_05505 [Planctomycetota bacterium]|nr:hypothetical protein [Planctomycetota bacterium]MDA1211948.1 hypothetical protein [Planctomycetota bacterium]
MPQLDDLSRPPQNWRQLLIDTERGVAAGLRSDSAAFAQLSVSCVTLAGALVLGLNLGQWSVMILALTVMLVMVFLQQAMKILIGVLEGDHPRETRTIFRVITAALSITWLGTLCSIGLIFYQRLTQDLGL